MGSGTKNAALTGYNSAASPVAGSKAGPSTHTQGVPTNSVLLSHSDNDPCDDSIHDHVRSSVNNHTWGKLGYV